MFLASSGKNIGSISLFSFLKKSNKFKNLNYDFVNILNDKYNIY